MNSKKTWSILADIIGVALTITMAVSGRYIGVVIIIAVWALVHILLGHSGRGEIIGVDHVDRPSGGSYGGGFAPGGLLGMGNNGTRFGVYGAPVAAPKAPRKEYRPESTGSKKSKTALIVGISAGVSLFITSLISWHAGTVGISALVALWLVVRSIRRHSGQGGVIGVDQQSQARGRPHDEGNGGVGRQTFSSPWNAPR